MRASYVVSAMLALGLGLNAALAQEQVSTEQQRAFLRERLTAQLRSVDEIESVHAKLDRMDGFQVQALYDYYRSAKADADQQRLAAAQSRLRQLEAYRDQLQQELARRQGAAPPTQVPAALARDYRPEAGAARRDVGFAPVVTWLPEGATLRAGAVVSPDRRYVRINATPFFSSIPAVNLYRLPQGYYPYGFGFGNRYVFPTLRHQGSYRPAGLRPVPWHKPLGGWKGLPQNR